MIKKSIITVVVILAILGIAFAANSNIKNPTNTTNTTNPTGNSENQVNGSVNNTTSNSNNTQTHISPSEAQKIAKTYIQVSGAAAGTPKLVNQDGKLVYIVPVIVKGTSVGEIDIDAKTGKNLGGAGGAP
jgi:uncharacterized membrane protein YkoI